ncbi:MAG: xylose isomerase, partial [Planctomycetota bacterium]
MKECFPEIKKIKYEGADSKNPLSFKHYNPDEVVLGKTMAEHLRFSVCYWHTFKALGADPFGPGTMIRDYNASSETMEVAEITLEAAFEFFTKLGVGFWCFHDRDIAPEADNLAETNKRLDKIAAKAKKLQDETGMKL